MSVLFVINHAKGSTNEIIKAHIHKIKKQTNTYNARAFERVMANHTKKATVSLQTINWHK